MPSYNVSVTQSISLQPDNVAAGGTMEYVISNPLGVDSYFTLETVPNANGAYDSTSPKNTSGSYTLGSGLSTLIQNDYFSSVIVAPGGGTLTLVPAINVVGSTLRLRGVGYTDVTIQPAVYEPEVIAWSLSSSVTDPFWLDTMNTAVQGLKNNNLWDLIVYLNPCAGTSSLSISTPLKHPQNLPSLIYGNPLINSYGVKGDGVGTYINTQMNIDPNIPSLYDVHSVFYQNLTSSFNSANGNGRAFGGYSIGQNTNSDGGWLHFVTNGSETNGIADAPYDLNPATRMSINLTGGKKWYGFVANSRTSSNYAFSYLNGNIEGTATNDLLTRSPNLSYGMTVSGRTGLWQRPFFWMGWNNVSNVNWDAGVRAQLDTRYVSEARFAWLSNGKGLTQSQLDTYYNIVQTAQISWGRNV